MDLCRDVYSNFNRTLRNFIDKGLVGQCQHNQPPNRKCIDAHWERFRFDSQDIDNTIVLGQSKDDDSKTYTYNACLHIQAQLSNSLHVISYEKDK